MSTGLDRFLPLLVHVQANLAGDLGLQVLARRAGLSASHFHRTFTAAVGETPRALVERLRLERAALRLLLHDDTVLEIALDCGYAHHETFTRAFRRAYGVPPELYRDHDRPRTASRTEAARAGSSAPGTFELSSTTVVRLRPAHLACVRHHGPYDAVPQRIFDQLQAWADRQRPPGPRVWMGIGHDAPGTTPPHRLRFDAALVVPGPVEQRDGVFHQLLPAGEYAATTHAGALDTLPGGYEVIFARAVALPRHRLVGLPAVEVYRTDGFRTDLSLVHTDVYLPVERRGRG